MTAPSRRNAVAVIWTAAGLLLIWRGLPYAGVLSDAETIGLTGASTWIALAVALMVGTLKGLTALRLAARRAAEHIARLGPAAPAWRLFSVPTLGLVAFFVGVGLVLRLAPYDAVTKAWVVGITYPAVGVSLLLGAAFVRSVDTRG